jgi:hypothetical protein
MRPIISMLALLVLLTGCAQMMAAGQPPNMDTTRVLRPGMSRDVVVRKLGTPTKTNHSDEGLLLIDTYDYVDGGVVNTWGAKMGRIVVYSAGDAFSGFLSQVIWMPMEAAEGPLSGRQYTAKVRYEWNDEADDWVILAWRETDLHSMEVVSEVVPPKGYVSPSRAEPPSDELGDVPPPHKTLDVTLDELL